MSTKVKMNVRRSIISGVTENHYKKLMVLIIDDMNLKPNLSEVNIVYAALFIEGIDSSNGKGDSNSEISSNRQQLFSPGMMEQMFLYVRGGYP